MADVVIRGIDPKQIDLTVHAKYEVMVLPEGHGRLGDLDALQEEFKKSHDGKRLMLIDTALTIIPAEGCETNAE